MAKTKAAQGPALSQRDRKKLALETRAKTEAQEAEKQRIEEEDAEKRATHSPFPQEQFIQWVADFCRDYFTMDRFIQVGALAFACYQAYITFDDTYTSEADINLIISTICGILALIAGIATAYRAQKVMKKKVGDDFNAQLPPWNTVYLVFLPVMMAYVYNRDLLLYNAAFTSSVLDLPWFAKLAIQASIITSNTRHSDLVSNLQIVLVHYAIHYALSKVSEMKSLDRVEVSLFSILLIDVCLIKSEALHFIILQKLLISFALGMGVIFVVTRVLRENTVARSLFLMLLWTSATVAATLYQLDPILGNNSAVWLFEYIAATKDRIMIISVWLFSLLLLIPTVFSYKIALSPNFRRKIWHFLILALIAYPLHVDPEFVKVALSGTLVLFLVLEQTRYLKLHPFGEFLDSHLRTFADFRDEKGPVIISYIYLIIGITIPILINGSPIGLIALGVGDSLASIVGSNWGEINWSRSQKTVEGTMTFILASFGVSYVFQELGWFFQDRSTHSLLLTATLSGILEGNSDMNDNILIPGYMVVLLDSLAAK